MACTQVLVSCCLLLSVSLAVARLHRRVERKQLPAGPTGARLSTQVQPGGDSLTWSFPEDPEDVVREFPAQFRPRQPDFSKSLAVKCGNDQITVEVNQDLLGLGKLVGPHEVTLGHCPPSDVDPWAQVLVFEAPLHECGSTRLMTEDAFIYAFELLYRPEASQSLITRSHRATLQVECHYLRNPHFIAGPVQLGPRDVQPRFSLQLKSDDWTSHRVSNRYGEQEFIRIRASVQRHGHAPLKVLLDHCVSTVEPAPVSEFDEAFLKNHGCLGGIESSFMAQTRPDELRFQMKASSFPLEKLILITCILKAIPASSPTTIENKSCFFDQRWRAVTGRDQFCSCCAASCGMRKARHVEEAFKAGEKWQTEESLGPIIIERRTFRNQF